MDYCKRKKRKTDPIETCSVFSKIFFLYTLQLFRKGYKKELQEEDLYEVHSKYRSQKLTDKLEQELKKQREKTNKISIFKLLWTRYGYVYILLGVGQVVLGIVTLIMEPEAIGKLVSYFTPGQKNVTASEAYYYGSVAIGLNLLNCLYIHNYTLKVLGIGIKVRTAMSSLIYRKILKISSLNSNIPIGKIVTLITKDVAAFETFIDFANDMWIAVIKSIIMFYILYRKIGYVVFYAVTLLLIILIVQIILATRIKSLKIEMCKRTDERLQLTQEALFMIRIIKMYAWESVFEKKIENARKNEMKVIFKVLVNKFLIILCGRLTSHVCYYAMLIGYAWARGNLTAEIVYFIFNSFQIIFVNMAYLLPIGVIFSAEVKAAIERIKNILESEELETIFDGDRSLPPIIKFDNVTIKIKDRAVLSKINLKLENGLTLLLGPTGSGKTIFLKTILREFSLCEGKLLVNGKISYAPQEPWLFPSTIKQNIVFGEKFDENRYFQVLHVCALDYDLNILELGDQTIVEDGGLNLSKGQQARITLARAVYRDSDLYLFDDCLAALDAHVSAFIFQECIRGFLKDKMIVLVTHNINFIKTQKINLVGLRNGTIDSSENVLNLLHNEKDISTLNRNTHPIINNVSSKQPVSNSEESPLLGERVIEKVYHEEKKIGKVDISVYKKYLQFCGGYVPTLLVLCFFILTQALESYDDKFISNWANFEEKVANMTFENNTSRLVEKRKEITVQYTILIIATSLATFGRIYGLYVLAKKASLKIHTQMVSSVMNSLVEFYDNNFLGNILNRFSKDLAAIDDTIPMVFKDIIMAFLNVIGSLVLITSVDIAFIVPSACLMVVLFYLRKFYSQTGRSLKRLEALTRSPIIGYMNASLEGLTVIRSSKKESMVKEEFDRHQDLYTSASFILLYTIRAFSFYLDAICTLFVAIIIAVLFFLKDDTNAGNAGLAITQALMLTGCLLWFTRQWADMENQMTSVERALEYTCIKQEEPRGMTIDHWPERGEVIYQNLSLTYNNSSQEVLKNIQLNLKPGEKIGIVGRTGSGKSSLIFSLFRLYNFNGKIFIDDIDINALSLNCLRSRLTIIPQDPFVFNGTIRENIDPLCEHEDSEIWRVVDLANLKSIVSSLDTNVSSNFSIGQKQLICLARAAIRRSRILVLDEATANVDSEMDKLVEDAIAANFSSCTVLKIAHKLSSVLNCDKVIVMNKGEIVECGEKSALIRDTNGWFYKMVNQADLLSSFNH